MIKRMTRLFVRKWVLFSLLFLLVFLTANGYLSDGFIAAAQEPSPTATPVADENGDEENNEGPGRVVTVPDRGERVDESAAITAVSDNPNQLAWAAYWPLNDSPPYDDAIGNRDGSCTNCPATFSDGQVGNARNFNGNNDAVRVNAAQVFDWAGSDSFSLELWVRADATNSCTGDEVMLGRGTAGAKFWSLGCDANGRVSFQLSDGSHTINVLSAQSIKNDRWHHLVATHDGSSHASTLYINGVAVGSVTHNFAGTFAAVSATVDMGHLNNGRFFDGILDEVAIYEGVLPPLTIKNHFHLVRNYQTSCDTVDIMPLGDSITRGFGTGAQPTMPNFNYGYRWPLYNSLTGANYDFDFVGSRADGGSSGLPDVNHEGHGGFTADEIESGLNTWLGANPPDVILLHVGTNDLLQSQTPDNARGDVDLILNKINDFDPDITVLLAQIAGIGTGHYQNPFTLPITHTVISYNNLLPPLAQTYVTNGEKVVLVNMFTALESPNYPANMFDNAHPNESGYNKMAPVWFNALDDFLPNCASPVFDSTPVTETGVNAPYTYQPHATGFPLATYSLQTPISGMTIDPATGQINWTPQQPGPQQVTVLAANSEGTASHTFTINVKHRVYIPLVIR